MICKYCNKERGDKFSLANTINGKKYYRNKCNVCFNIDKKERRHKRKDFVDSIRKKAECALCGVDDFRALQFHHRGDKEKDVSNTRGWSEKRIEKEIAKCDIICANCHMIHHYNERN